MAIDNQDTNNLLVMIEEAEVMSTCMSINLTTLLLEMEIREESSMKLIALWLRVALLDLDKLLTLDSLATRTSMKHQGRQVLDSQIISGLLTTHRDTKNL